MIPLLSDSRFATPGRVLQVSLERSDGKLDLRLVLEDGAQQVRAELRFAGVSKLRFPSASTDLLGLVLLQGEDVTKRGWEGVRYEIKDYEEEFISFYCEAFEMTFLDGC